MEKSVIIELILGLIALALYIIALSFAYTGEWRRAFFLLQSSLFAYMIYKQYIDDDNEED